MLSPEGSYLETPFYDLRLTPQVFPAERPPPTYAEYDLFCMRTRMRPYLGDMRIIFRPVPDSTDADIKRDKIIGQLVDKVSDYIIVEPDRVAQLQQALDSILKDNPKYCLLVSGRAPLGVSEGWWRQQWRNYKPPTEYKSIQDAKGNWMVDLSEHDDYGQRYDDLLVDYAQILQQRWRDNWSKTAWTEPTSDTKWHCMPNLRILHEIAKSTDKLLQVGDYINVPAGVSLKLPTLEGSVMVGYVPKEEITDDVVSYESMQQGKSVKAISLLC